MTTDLAAQQRAQLYIYAAAHVDPKLNHKHMEESLKEYNKGVEDQLVEDLRTGLAVFERQPPRQQLDAFITSTLQEDLPFILTEGWYEARMAGLAQPLMAEVLYYQEQGRVQVETQLAEITGGPMPMPSEPQPYFMWPRIIQCRSLVFHKLVSQFKALLRDEARKQGTNG